MKAKSSIMVFSLLLSVAIGVVISRGGGQHGKVASGRSRLLIGLSMDTLKEERWQGDRDMFVARCKELGADVLPVSANSDDSRQVSDVEGLISRNVQVLVIVPHDGRAMAKAVAIAHQAGIPVLAYDRIIRDSDLDLYMSFDNIRVGELQARYLVDHLPTTGKGRIVRIYGSKTDNNAFQYKEGQDHILAPYLKSGAIRVVHEDWAEDWKPENGKKITNAAITKLGGNFDAILVSNDGTAGGAVQALVEEGYAEKILVTGQDAELVACQRIVNGTQTMTIYKPLKNLARSAAEVAVQMAKGRPVIATQTVPNGKIDVPSILCDVVTVTKDNMMDTVVKDGFHTREEIYGAQTSDEGSGQKR